MPYILTVKRKETDLLETELSEIYIIDRNLCDLFQILLCLLVALKQYVREFWIRIKLGIISCVYLMYTLIYLSYLAPKFDTNVLEKK
jgi:hypothetical protein